MLKVSTLVQQKLRDKHGVTLEQIKECFANREKGFLIDCREEHKTDPQTLWFISETDYGVKIKVVFMCIDNDIVIKTAYRPNNTELRIYENNA